MATTINSDRMIKDALKENSDGLQSIQLENRLGRSLNSFFNARRRIAGTQTRIDVDTYWTDDGLVLPANTSIAIYSRATFLNPILGMRIRLEAPSSGSNLIGFEPGSYYPIGYTALRYTADVAQLLVVGGDTGILLRVDSLLPSDFRTARHVYVLKVNKCNVELFCDESLVGIILTGLPEAIPTWENNPPYSIGSNNLRALGRWTFLLEPDNGTAAEFSYPIRAGENDIVATDGPELPPRQYAVYNENSSTKWSSLATNGATQTSHPIPVWGYANKTIYVKADAAGTLEIQAYIGGGWQVYDSIVLTANELEAYYMSAIVPIIRLVYEPTNNDTISLAEVYMA